MIQKLKAHFHRAAHESRRFVRDTPNKFLLLGGVGAVLVGVVVYQFFYPTNTLVPFASIDNVELGGKQKSEAVKTLDRLYSQANVSIYFDDSKSARTTPKLPELGVTIKNEARVTNYDYPWYWRLIPSSVWWYHAFASAEAPTVTRDENTLAAYMKKQFGENCEIQPINATITQRNDTFSVVKDVIGGTCDAVEVKKALSNVDASMHPGSVTVHGTTMPAAITREEAESELTRLKAMLDGTITIAALNEKKDIPVKAVSRWIVYDSTGDELVLQVSSDADGWLNDTYGSKVAVAPGVTKVSTYDFTETSRVNGAPGRTLDTVASRDALAKQLSGDASVSTIATKPVEPTVQYTRSYSSTDEGLSALMKNYAESHPGTYGVSMVELTGQKRRAEYNATTQFTTASTYKMFIAYSVLLRIERGEWSWGDQINGGRDASTCFEDMIRKSDNACSEAFLKKVGFQNATNEAKSIGATQTSFLGSDGIKSTARDESTLLGALYAGQILSQQSSRDKFIAALKGNVYRRGIPAGIPSATVADKVGFMDALLHDAAIVYAPTGTYVLVIMTNNATWGNIAELAGQIEALRAQ